MKFKAMFTLIFALLILAACKPEPKPRLLVFISMDHFAYHTYNHYRPAFTGGFKWLEDHGVSFENAHHEHGYTSTGPGHFVLGSGMYPGPAGVLGNNWWDRIQKKNVYCVEDPDAQALDIPAGNLSYDKVNGSSFGDWLKASSPRSKVYSVACKDRAAIMLGGKNPDLADWYNWQGAFTTTDYYTREIPAWLKDFNADLHLLSYRDSVWTPLCPAADYLAYAHADSFYGETDRYLTNPYSPVFPIGFEPEWDDSRIYTEIAGRPWMDRITLELALRAAKEAHLGQDATPDVLNIGLSPLDLIAHYYGPYSWEAMDHLLRVDQYLKTFLETLDVEIGLENVVIALSTDHGGLPLPEHWTQVMGKTGGRVNEEVYLATRAAAYALIDSTYGDHDFIYRKGSSYYYDHAAMDERSVQASVIDSILQHYMESVEGVHRLYTKAELLAADSSDEIRWRLRHFMHPVLSPDLYTLEEYGWIFRNPWGTTHSTPYDYDSHVPFIVARQGESARRIGEHVSTVDIAPTLAEILGIKPADRVDGKSVLPLIHEK